jgi:alpha-galactosidase
MSQRLSVLRFKAIFVLVSVFALAGIAGASEPLGIHGPARVGVVTGKPFLYLIPATGEAPLAFTARTLPSGLSLDAATGIISGTAPVSADVTVELSVTDKSGTATRNIQFTVAQDAMALTPIMAWNPWYVWGCNIDDKKIRQAADLLVSTGLASHGYNYINLDDCWQGSRDANGEMVPNARFPDMKALSDYVHSKGLRIGIYTSPNTKTCAGYPGSQDHNEQDIATYAKWGMDLIKYDWCGSKADEKTTYQTMGDILAKSPRAMYYLMCQYGVEEVWKWGTQVGGNSWRTNNDLADTWEAVLLNGFKNIGLAEYQSPGHWNDLDMLMVGKANWPKSLGHYTIPNDPPRESQLTDDEKLTHMSLWSLLASPIIFSGDPSQIDAATFAQLTNDDVLAVNQDPAAKPAKLVSNVNNVITVSRPMADGSVAVGFFNLGTARVKITTDFISLGLPSVVDHVTIRDLWTHKELTSKRAIDVNIAPHGVVFARMRTN